MVHGGGDGWRTAVPHMNVRDLGRLREIAAVFARHGFGHLVQGTPIDVGGENKSSPLSVAERVRQLLIELGPTFVKLGQVLSVRPDILPGPPRDAQSDDQ